MSKPFALIYVTASNDGWAEAHEYIRLARGTDIRNMSQAYYQSSVVRERPVETGGEMR